ncbi:LysE/ArgO family amino acid transporter [Leifsonia sp. A12D58]|uniref:LysE/ArgO family amino acid transporter n=1 Tax=Leifsonia sp. A12D58 TaxID=3397674 RepID=UPI0039DFA948
MVSENDFSAALAGLGLGFSLIIAIGAQNAFVLRQGIRREHVFVVVAICALSDAVLILLGISGIGFVIERIPVLLDVIRYAGAAFLLGYGVLAARRAIRPNTALTVDEGATRVSLRSAVLTVLALTWLNPHVYLDTILLLGSVANTHGDPGRWYFGVGAVIASIVWFTVLGYGARMLGPLFARPIAWRILDGAIALTMFVLGLKLLLGW